MSKKEIFSKLNVKDYNNELEKVLEKKNFSSDTKNLLLSMFYKLEIAYEDYAAVKKQVPFKKEFIEEIIQIIQSECNHIQLIKPQSEQSKELENINYIIDKTIKEIKCYPNERYLLNSLYRLQKTRMISHEKYSLIQDFLADFLKTGRIMSLTEIIRDFNGWSWATIRSELESIEYNLIYQNIAILLGIRFLEKWEKAEQEDCLAEFERRLEEFGQEYKNTFLSHLYAIMIIYNILNDEAKKKQLLKGKQTKQNELDILRNKETFLVTLAEDKKKYLKEIKRIETVLEDKELLRKELTQINKKLPETKKIFNLDHLKCVLNKTKREIIKKIDHCNFYMDPKNYVKTVSNLQTNLSFFKGIDIENSTSLDLDDHMLNLQRTFLDCFVLKVKQAEKKDLIDLVYYLRYYWLLPYDKDLLIFQKEELQKAINFVGKELISKACEQKLITIIHLNKQLNYKIISRIFALRIIRLENIYFKIKLKGQTLGIEIYDDEMLEKIEEIELEEKEMEYAKKFLIKFNKKFKLIL